VADDAILRRIDAHMERGNAHMERGNELMEELRTFMRELTLRHERIFVPVIERLEEGTRALREQGGALRELIEESRAQRAALFRILDRLDDGGATSGA
jgi:hypothetical protein